MSDSQPKAKKEVVDLDELAQVLGLETDTNRIKHKLKGMLDKIGRRSSPHRGYAPPLGKGYEDEYLTGTEFELLELLSQCNTLFNSICGVEYTRDKDMQEVTYLIRSLQNKVLSQSAARVYPYRFRLLGEYLAPI